ncbi:MAG: hypothetical protein DRP15_04300 [Candidatus Aenigmatarchaeota archaeon]|nr:MAG: hypothetical protein DRP15_04300 [Candidatus Aenigmarchaeota archaeon]
MAYTTLALLKRYMPENKIMELTDDDGIDEISEEIVNEMIDQAQTIIDSYCRGRYPVDMSDDDVPELIQDIATKLTAYKLYARRLITTLPETLSRDYKYCIDMLKQIQSGKINPWPIANNPVIFWSNKTSSDKIYTRALLNTYWRNG